MNHCFLSFPSIHRLVDLGSFPFRSSRAVLSQHAYATFLGPPPLRPCHGIPPGCQASCHGNGSSPWRWHNGHRIRCRHGCGHPSHHAVVWLVPRWQRRVPDRQTGGALPLQGLRRLERRRVCRHPRAHRPRECRTEVQAQRQRRSSGPGDRKHDVADRKFLARSSGFVWRKK